MTEELNTTQAAEYLGVAPATLARWRSAGQGPSYIKIGRIRYTKQDLDAYKEARRVEGEA